MFHKFYFEKLDVWQNSRKFSVGIYQLTTGFPNEEKFGLTSQIRRAAISISANIAEGMSRNTNKDKVRFLNIAFASAIETLNFLILSFDLELITNDQYKEMRLKLEKITNQIQALSNSLKI